MRLIGWVQREEITPRATRSRLERDYLTQWNGHELDSGPTRAEVSRQYGWLLQRALFLTSGRTILGVSPDDLVSVALANYVTLIGKPKNYPPDHAYRMASHGLQQDVRDLLQKEKNNPTDSTDHLREVLGERSDDWWHPEAPEMAPRYFHPDTVDMLAGALSDRELEVIFALYEGGLSPTQVADKLGVSTRRIRALRMHAEQKIGQHWTV